MTMSTQIRCCVLLLTTIFLSPSFVLAESNDFSTAVGVVEKFEKDTLTIKTIDKAKKTLELKVTGTSKFHQMVPRAGSGKTIITQRAAETSDLANGQPVAVIYTVANEENVLLTAVIKPVDKEKK